jgi:hypothetical protein
MITHAFNRVLSCVDSCRNYEHLESCLCMAMLFLLQYDNEYQYNLLLGAIALKRHLLENQPVVTVKSQYPVSKPFITDPINYN